MAIFKKREKQRVPFKQCNNMKSKAQLEEYLSSSDGKAITLLNLIKENAPRSKIDEAYNTMKVLKRPLYKDDLFMDTEKLISLIKPKGSSQSAFKEHEAKYQIQRVHLATFAYNILQRSEQYYGCMNSYFTMVLPYYDRYTADEITLFLTMLLYRMKRRSEKNKYKEDYRAMINQTFHNESDEYGIPNTSKRGKRQIMKAIATTAEFLRQKSNRELKEEVSYGATAMVDEFLRKIIAYRMENVGNENGEWSDGRSGEEHFPGDGEMKRLVDDIFDPEIIQKAVDNNEPPQESSYQETFDEDENSDSTGTEDQDENEPVEDESNDVSEIEPVENEINQDPLNDASSDSSEIENNENEIDGDALKDSNNDSSETENKKSDIEYDPMEDESSDSSEIEPENEIDEDPLNDAANDSSEIENRETEIEYEPRQDDESVDKDIEYEDSPSQGKNGDAPSSTGSDELKDTEYTANENIGTISRMHLTDPLPNARELSAVEAGFSDDDSRSKTKRSRDTPRSQMTPKNGKQVARSTFRNDNAESSNSRPAKKRRVEDPSEEEKDDHDENFDNDNSNDPENEADRDKSISEKYAKEVLTADKVWNNPKTNRQEKIPKTRERALRWTTDEVLALEEGLNKLKKRAWAVILQKDKERFGDHTATQLKDKAVSEFKRRVKLGIPLGGFYYVEQPKHD